MKRLKKILPEIIIGLIFLVGVCVLLYPTVAEWWNGRVQSRAVAVYNEAVADMPEEDYSRYYDEARAYNEALYRRGSSAALADPDLVEGYEDTLKLDGTDVMGYITIDKIDVNLPIYHGTSDSVLAAGAGHLEGSSLPVGGESTHCVLSGHRGLPSARLFTDLDKLEVGDTFELHVLGDTLAYEIDQIVTVLPTEIEELYIHEGEDLCTLMTCTPYGINTHRLLLRGHRIPYGPEEEEQHQTGSAAVSDDNNRIVMIIIIVVGAVILILALSQMFVMIGRKRNRKH